VQGLSDADTAAGLGVPLDELSGRLIADNQRLESQAVTVGQLGAACTADTVDRVDYALADTVAVLDGAGTALHELSPPSSRPSSVSRSRRRLAWRPWSSA
jgi:hypothetical protein